MGRNIIQRDSWLGRVMRQALLSAAIVIPSIVHAQPANDDPCGAFLLQANNNGYYCPTPYNGTTAAATNTAVPAAASCSNNTGDVWYRFVATATEHHVSCTNVVPLATGTFITTGMAVYNSTGASCSALSETGCTTFHTLNLSGLTVGETYYVRIWTANPASDPQFTFDLCVGTPPPPPVNEECSGALSLNDGMLHTVATNNATESLPPSDCGWGLSATPALDVWYTITAATSGVVTVQATGYESYVNLEAYSSCNSTPIGCNDESPAILTLNTIAGSTYYLRLYGRDGSGYMTIQATGTPLPLHTGQLSAILKADNNVLLRWHVADNETAAPFYIERSGNGTDFEVIGTMTVEEPGTGIPDFTDGQPLANGNYYRIRRQDKDGRSVLSNIAYIRIRPTHGQAWTIYPNPAGSVFNINIREGNAAEGRLIITDMTGRTIRAVPVQNGRLNLDMSKEPAGVYLFRYTDTYLNLKEKVIKR